jgi:hypothetical protein
MSISSLEPEVKRVKEADDLDEQKEPEMNYRVVSRCGLLRHGEVRNFINFLLSLYLVDFTALQDPDANFHAR